MTFLDQILCEAVAHPVYTALLVAGVVATVGAYFGNRTYDRLLREFDAQQAPLPSNVRVLYPNREAM